jgi:thioredoxin 1
MNKTTRIIIALAVVAVAALAFIAKQNKVTSPAGPVETDVMAADLFSNKGDDSLFLDGDVVAKVKQPRLVDLGAGKCIPCKMMKPILDDLKANYSDHFSTEFIDMWENPDAGKQYGIEVIPTQIFYNAEGKELFRHVGFYGKEDILVKWKELGVDVAVKPVN